MFDAYEIRIVELLYKSWWRHVPTTVFGGNITEAFILLSWMSHVMKRPRQPAMQLYRPNDDTLTQEAELLLQRTDLLEQDVLDFLRGAPRRASVGTSQINETLRQQFRERRGEIRRLKEDLRSGRAMIDEDDRLVPLSTPLPRTRQPLPNLPQVINIDQHEEQLVEQERRETTEAITRAVAQYREQGVPEEEFELIMVPLRPPPQNLIFSAFVAVVSAFTIAILLALPSMISHDALEPFFDKLMYELVHVRHFDSHLAHCPGLQRNPSQSLKGQVLQKFGLLWDEDCGDGVLHIPARHVALDKYLQASTKKSAELLRPFKEGFNVSWTLPCDSTRVADPHQCRATDVDECVIDSSSRAKCFRGVHDNVLSVKDTTDVLLFGNFLVQQQGSDNFNVFYATHLERKLPEVMQKLKLLLHERYDLSELEPLIFRITSTGPADGYGVDPHSMALNQTVSLQLCFWQIGRTQFL